MKRAAVRAETIRRFDDIVNNSRLSRPSMTNRRRLDAPRYTDQFVSWSIMLGNGQEEELFIPLADLQSIATTATTPRFQKEVAAGSPEQKATPNADNYQAYVYKDGKRKGVMNRVQVPNGLVLYVTAAHIAREYPFVCQRKNTVSYFDVEPDYVWIDFDIACWVETKTWRDNAAAMGWATIPVREIDGYPKKPYSIYFCRTENGSETTRFSTSPLTDELFGFFSHEASTQPGDSGAGIISPAGKRKRAIVAIHLGGVVTKRQNNSANLMLALSLVGKNFGIDNSVPDDIIEDFFSKESDLWDGRKNRRRANNLYDQEHQDDEAYRNLRGLTRKYEQISESNTDAYVFSIITPDKAVITTVDPTTGDGSRHSYPVRSRGQLLTEIFSEEISSRTEGRMKGDMLTFTPDFVTKPPVSFVEHMADLAEKEYVEYERSLKVLANWIRLKNTWNQTKKTLNKKNREYVHGQITLRYDEPFPAPTEFVTVPEEEVVIQPKKKVRISQPSHSPTSEEDVDPYGHSSIEYQPPSEDLGSGSISISETDQSILADFAPSNFQSKSTKQEKFVKESSDGGNLTQQLAIQDTTTEPDAEPEDVDLDNDEIPIKPKVKNTDVNGLIHQAKAFITMFSKMDVEHLRERADRQLSSEEDDVIQIEDVLLPELNRKVGLFGAFLGANKHATNDLINYWQDQDLYKVLGMSYNTFVSFVECSNSEYVSLIKKLETKVSLTPSAQEVKLMEAKDLLSKAKNVSHSLRTNMTSLKAGIKSKGGLAQAKGNLNTFSAKALVVENKLNELEALLIDINDSFIKESADNEIAGFQATIDDATALLDVLSHQVFRMARADFRSGGSSPGERSEPTTSSTADGQGKKKKKSLNTMKSQ